MFNLGICIVNIAYIYRSKRTYAKHLKAVNLGNYSKVYWPRAGTQRSSDRRRSREWGPCAEGPQRPAAVSPPSEGTRSESAWPRSPPRGASHRTPRARRTRVTSSRPCLGSAPCSSRTPQPPATTHNTLEIRAYLKKIWRKTLVHIHARHTNNSCYFCWICQISQKTKVFTYSKNSSWELVIV